MTTASEAHNLMSPAYLQDRVMHLEQENAHLRFLLESNLRERVAGTLFRFQEGGVVSLTHGQLAELVVAKRESVSKTLAELRELGVVQTGYGRVTIVDLERLMELAGQEASE